MVNRRFLFGKKDYIFILSHIRSNSSLLSHILGSHEEISGHSEMHQSYNGIRDLVKLRYKISRFQTPANLKGRYVLDKMLTDRSRISSNILSRSNIYWIFLLRSPEDMFKSIINMGNNLVDIEWYRDPDKILKYYNARLKNMGVYAQKLRGKSVLIKSEDLINDTEVVLNFLTDWLGLESRLKPEYNIFSDTGLPWFGDPSGVIKSGHIVKKRPSYDDIFVPKDILENAYNTYEKCQNLISNYSENILNVSSAIVY